MGSGDPTKEEDNETSSKWTTVPKKKVVKINKQQRRNQVFVEDKSENKRVTHKRTKNPSSFRSNNTVDPRSLKSTKNDNKSHISDNNITYSNNLKNNNTKNFRSIRQRARTV